MFEVADLSLKAGNMGAQMGVGRIKLTQLTVLAGMMMVMVRGRGRGGRRSSAEMMTTLGTTLHSTPTSAGLLTAAGVGRGFSLQVRLQLTDLMLETPAEEN